MEEQYISFATAKLAKEKGLKQEILWDSLWMYNEIGENECLVDISEYQRQNLHKWYPKPTQSLLQKWLREEKKIDVVAIPVRFTGYLEIGYYTHIVCGIQPMKNYRFDTYEIALEVGLKEALTLI